MGWTSIKHSGDIIKDLKKCIIGSDKNFEILEHSIKSNVIYLAVKNKIKNVILAEIVLYNIKNGEIFFKDMSEFEGPYYYGCPKKIIKLLSPTDNEYALEWRKKCSLKLKTGEKVTFKEPILCYGEEHKEFTYYGNNLFVPLGENFGIRCTNWRDYI